jgi:DNA invertase Pin-like site-specific DNA recombinase
MNRSTEYSRMNRTVALYMRVSTDGQDVELQRRELVAACERHGWDVVAEFVDQGISGSKGREQRPAFDRLCKDMARKRFDLVAAWSVDRLGRSLQHLVAFLGELRGAGVDLYLHKQGLDTSTPTGRAMFGMCGIFAEFEREMIVERVRAGIAKARVNGTRSGRPIGGRALPQERVEAVRVALGQGLSIRAVARAAGVSVGKAHQIATAAA